jgi:hypothetical protein
MLLLCTESSKTMPAIENATASYEPVRYGSLLEASGTCGLWTDGH